jgi:hypothetical protein
MSQPVRLDDTSGCPLGVRCESCGAERDDPKVCTLAFGRLGVACLTLCGPCASSTVTPPVTVATAVHLVEQHTEHLRITVEGHDDDAGGAATARE